MLTKGVLRMTRGAMAVLTEPGVVSSSWYTRFFSGLRQEASRCDIAVLPITSASELPSSTRACVLFGNDARWARHAVKELGARGIRGVLSGAQPDAFYGVSGAMIDRRLQTADMVRYFVANGRKRLAYLGGAPWDVNDAIRTAAFRSAARAEGLSAREEDVFSSEQDLDACVLRMLERVGRYDGVLCANDQTGVRLIALAREKGVRVPEDLFVAGTGNLLVGQLSSPTLTTTEIDYFQMGRKTVDVWQYIERTPDVEAATVTILHRLIPRGSTAMCPIPDANRGATASGQPAAPLSDPALEAIDRFETCLFHCDPLDLRILSGIADGKSMERIATDLFVALGTVNYRAKKLYRAMDVASRRELENALRRQIADPAALEKMAAPQEL